MSALRSLLTPITLAGRRMRSDLPLTGAVFGVVLVTSFVFAAAPRYFESTADDGLRFAVSKASPFERNVEITQAGRIEPSASDPITAVAAAVPGLNLRLCSRDSRLRIAIDTSPKSMSTGHGFAHLWHTVQWSATSPNSSKCLSEMPRRVCSS